MSRPSGFSKLRALLWPIYSNEHRKFVPMFLIFFLICFNYSILRSVKDSLIITAPHAGAEVLPFLKVWIILPAALLFTFIFTRLSNHLSREKVFYAMIGIFLAFFTLFTFVLYPFHDVLHPHTFADKLQASLPQGFSGLIAIFRNWTFTTFYIMSEMWSTMIMTVLFWGFANEVTSVRDGKRFYAILGLGANLATTLSGGITGALAAHKFNPIIPYGQTSWDQTLFFINFVLIISGLISMGLFRWLQNRGLGYSSTTRSKAEESKKIKMGIRENSKYLAKSKYLISIAVVVLMFNIALTLIEVVWKDQVKQLYPNPSDFTSYMSNVMMGVGLIATFGAFISASIMRKFSWTTSALIPPAIFLVTGVMFFSFFLLKDTALASWTALIGATPLAIGVFFGSLQNIFARASKYTLFDATKELSFIPLSKESRMKGKAAIDGFGSRLGKSGASVIHQGLIMVFGSISVSAPYVGAFLFFIIGGWIAATRILGKEFHKLTLGDEKLEITEEAEDTPKPEPAMATSDQV